MLSGVAFLFFELCLHLILREYLVEGEEGEILLILQKIFEPIMLLQNIFEPIVVLFACKKKQWLVSVADRGLHLLTTVLPSGKVPSPITHNNSSKAARS